jgi:hypothetical protein
LFQSTLEKTNFNSFIFCQLALENHMLDGRASSSSFVFLACMLQMPITFFPLVPTPQSAINVFIASESPSSVYNSKMEDIPNLQVEKLLGGLSPEQIQSLLLLLQKGHQPNIQKSEPIKGGFKASPWPKWNREDLLFPLYFARLCVKVKADQ